MSISKKNKELLRITEQLEKDFIKNMTAEYTKAYTEMKKYIYRAVDKYGIDGKVSRTELYKYNRFQTLQKQIMSELKNISLGEPQVSGYLFNQYDINYFQSGYILETEYQVKLAYGNLNKQRIKTSLLTPLNKISLKSNRELIQNKIRSSIIQSIAQGEGIAGLSERIKKNLEQNANNAVRIARTETTRVMNQAKQDSYDHAEKKGLPLRKQWVSTLDDSTRESHQDVDGEVVLLDQAFSNGLMYPGDQAGPPEEVINCRCTMITVIAGYENENEFRRARGTNGTNKVIEYKDYSTWKKERVK